VKVKVPGICCYAIRHSYATNALLRGVDPITLAVLMGHQDTGMIAKVYQHLTANPTFLLDAARKATEMELAKPEAPKSASNTSFDAA
jgi:integrase